MPKAQSSDAYSAKLNRRARRLGVTLPQRGTVSDGFRAPSSHGKTTLTFGKGKSTRFVVQTAEGWKVRLHGRDVQEFTNPITSLRDAIKLAQWLGTKSHRRALYGRRPKAEGAASTTVDPKGQLADMLGKVNGGAVRVKGA